MKDQAKEIIRSIYDEGSILNEVLGSNDFILKGIPSESLIYDSKINMLAWLLPSYDDFSASTVYVWQ